MRTLLIAATLLASAQTETADAWGPEGHSIVAEIAQRRLSDEARAGVASILGGPGVSLASFGSWADDERARDKNTSRWHFVNPVRGDTSYDPQRHCQFVKGQGDCLIAALEREVGRMACDSETPERRQRALKFIVHLIGDLHQPLHAIGEERGGNGVTVTVDMREGANPRPRFESNLHKVWDETLLQTIAWSWGSYVERLEIGPLSTADVPSLTVGSVSDWLFEAHRAGLEIFDATPKGSTIDDAYRIKMEPVVDRQLAVGGLRLAKLLDKAFAAKQCAS